MVVIDERDKDSSFRFLDASKGFWKWVLLYVKLEEEDDILITVSQAILIKLIISTRILCKMNPHSLDLKVEEYGEMP